MGPPPGSPSLRSGSPPYPPLACARGGRDGASVVLPTSPGPFEIVSSSVQVSGSAGDTASKLTGEYRPSPSAPSVGSGNGSSPRSIAARRGSIGSGTGR